MPTKNKVIQCRSCPWRVGAQPDTEIPGYRRKMHENLACTIASGIDSLTSRETHFMACHYSSVGDEFACAGWLANQLGPGNNLAMRLAVMYGRIPLPVTDGPQHERFEDTLT